MSKQVTVPESVPGNPQKIIINGVEYVLKPGSTVTVPDEVAAELARMLEASTHTAPEVEPPFDAGGGGSGGGALIVTDTGGILDKTWQEIHDAAPLVWMQNEATYYPCMAVANAEEQYFVAFSNLAGGEPDAYAAESADDYPVLVQQVIGGGGQ